MIYKVLSMGIYVHKQIVDNDFQEGNKSGTVSLVGRYVFYLCTNSKLFLRISQVIESKLFLGISHRISLKEV